MLYIWVYEIRMLCLWFEVIGEAYARAWRYGSLWGLAKQGTRWRKRIGNSHRRGCSVPHNTSASRPPCEADCLSSNVAPRADTDYLRERVVVQLGGLMVAGGFFPPCLMCCTTWTRRAKFFSLFFWRYTFNYPLQLWVKEPWLRSEVG